jgi:hypothetical protein
MSGSASSNDDPGALPPNTYLDILTYISKSAHSQPGRPN